MVGRRSLEPEVGVRVPGPQLSAVQLVAILVATAALVYMGREAHDQWTFLTQKNGFGTDFHGTIWNADKAVLDGRTPYPSPSVVEMRPAVPPAVYMPPIFVATLPLGLVPLHDARWIWFAILVVAALAIPLSVGVRNPWCLALWMLSLPVMQALVLGNATVLVALGTALTWRFRDRRFAGPIAAAAAVSVKLWLWPLLLWLLITRPRAGLRAVLALICITLVAWAALGFHGLLGYPSLIHSEAKAYIQISVLLIAALALLHIDVKIATAAGVAVGASLLACAYLLRRRDLDSFALALLAALIATPVAWPHYLMIVAIPLMIGWPSLSIAWAWFPLVY